MQFEVIAADPAWSYDDKALAGQRGAGCKYSLTSDADIAYLPVELLAADDCVLFLWATMPKIREALDTMKAWGFTYKTVAFVWVKTTLDGQGFRFGMGRWTRANAELVLLGTRGKPKRLSAAVGQIVAVPPGRHSAKPQEVRDRIVQLVGDKPRVELFARDVAPGWMALGSDLDGGQDLMETIPTLAAL